MTTMSTAIKLSDLIERGSRLPYVKHSRKRNAPTYVRPSAAPGKLLCCAMGMACMAYIEELDDLPPDPAHFRVTCLKDIGTFVSDLAIDAHNVVAHPVTPSFYGISSINNIIIDLNDHHGWSPAQIVDWLRSIGR